jgi:hypothetical protein
VSTPLLHGIDPLPTEPDCLTQRRSDVVTRLLLHHAQVAAARYRYPTGLDRSDHRGVDDLASAAGDVCGFATVR